MNNYKTLFVCMIMVLPLLPNSALAQGIGNGDFLVLNNGDTLYGHVKHINEAGIPRRFYKKIRLTTVEGNRKKFNRKRISAFRSGNADYESFWLNQSTNKILLVNPKYDVDKKVGRQYFLKAVSKGKLSHYELEWFEQADASLLSMALLKNENDSYFIRANQVLLGLKRNVLKDYFFNCPILQEAILQKQVNEVGQITEYYNRHCAD
jgi:hypothetical protein